MEVRCVICVNRGQCDHVEWGMNEGGMYEAATEIEDCPDFELSIDHVSEYVAQEVLMLDPDLYGKAQVQFALPDSLHVRIFLKRNILDNSEVIKDLREEVTEMLENLTTEILPIKNMRIQLDFAFEQENNPEIPNELPADIMETEGRCPMGEEDPDEGSWGEEDDWENDEEEFEE